MPKKINSGELVPVANHVRGAVHHLRGSLMLVPVDAVFHVPSVHPKGTGPWQSEADKIAWTDRMSGMGCIIKRSTRTGCLGGYVGIGPAHPLFGVTPGALVGLNLRAHGGINYAAACQRYEPEAISICHVHISDPPTLHSQHPAASVGTDHDEAWWLGFSCDQATDVIPDARYVPHGRDIPPGINERVYRDEAFVYRECVHLAAQLRAVVHGVDPAQIVPEQLPVPIYDCIPFAVKVDFSDYDALPLAVTFVDPFQDRELTPAEMMTKLPRCLPFDPAIPTEIASQLPPQVVELYQHYPQFPQLPGFLCLPGTRAYHAHPAHSGDPWKLHRGTGEGRLFALLEVLWRYGTAPVDQLMVNFGLGISALPS